MQRWIFVLAFSVVAAGACRSTPESSNSSSFATQSAGSSVSFAITPRSSGEDQLILDVRATTHSGDLSELDLAKSVTLHVGDRTFDPVEAPSLRGHHDGGALSFEPKQKLEHFAVTIRGVRDMPELRLEW